MSVHSSASGATRLAMRSESGPTLHLPRYPCGHLVYSIEQWLLLGLRRSCILRLDWVGNPTLDDPDVVPLFDCLSCCCLLSDRWRIDLDIPLWLSQSVRSRVSPPWSFAVVPLVYTVEIDCQPPPKVTIWLHPDDDANRVTDAIECIPLDSYQPHLDET